ncbi:TetR family transcriptional regulator [Allosaccharopolyspora coralli]|uniref:TetR family transcriptional regulator n=1 Tax=Allosaccharopolyspora coralli TaxID=2665642 RepID=A0A5Q3Q5A3_9PSEU|nr:TetR family transcriptional regulator [Allosaccharopolyspora coralli]QGK69642.1 TetR family transcriptional regulator [Allosaccharopolyspora coralli]
MNRSVDAEADGRRRKGEHRRRLLLEATIRVLGHSGAAGVTQRAVAREAGLPPSAVLYYFATVESLLLATLTACNDRYIERLEQIGAESESRALELLAAEISGDACENRARLHAEYELFLLAARNHRLRTELDRWTAALDALMARYVPEPTARAGVTAAVDGLFLRCLCGQHSTAPEQVRETLASLLR